MARRTVKAHFNRLFMRFGITGGIKRVKLATILFRRQQWSERNISESVRPTSESSESLSSSLKASKTAKLRTRSAQPSTSLKTTYAPFTTNSDSGTESNSHSGTKHGVRDRKSTRLNSSHVSISYAVFCLKKKKKKKKKIISTIIKKE